jgi:hypothetical protein
MPLQVIPNDVIVTSFLPLVLPLAVFLPPILTLIIAGVLITLDLSAFESLILSVTSVHLMRVVVCGSAAAEDRFAVVLRLCASIVCFWKPASTGSM